MPSIHRATIREFHGYGPTPIAARVNLRQQLVAAGKDWDYGHIPVTFAQIVPIQPDVLIMEILPCPEC